MGFFDKFRSSKSWSKKGYTLMRKGKHKEALIYLDKALELDPGDISSLHNKSVVLSYIGDVKMLLVFWIKP